MKNNSVTLKDIAQKVGCSSNTVSLALRNSARVSTARREEIHAVAEQLGYVANQAARHLRLNKSRLIGLYARGLYDAVRTEMVTRLVAALHQGGYRVVLGLPEEKGEQWQKSSWMQTYREMQVEAVVVVSDMSVKLPSWSDQTPIILVGCSPNAELACDVVALDRREAGMVGTRHLLARGHKKILVATPMDHGFGLGCLQVLKEARLTPYQIPYSMELDAREGRMAGYNCVKQYPEVTAAILGDSGLAAGFIRGVLDGGKRVPEDVAVVGYDYFPWAEMLAVPLTTIEQPITTMAALALDLIQRRLEDRSLEPMHLAQPHTLVIRGSS